MFWIETALDKTPNTSGIILCFHLMKIALIFKSIFSAAFEISVKKQRLLKIRFDLSEFVLSGLRKFTRKLNTINVFELPLLKGGKIISGNHKKSYENFVRRK